MKYDLNKVREECLRLMGWKQTSSYHLIWWTSPDGSDTGSTGDYSFHKQAPNPTTSLDDAIPLMEFFRMTLDVHIGIASGNPMWRARGLQNDIVTEGDSAPLVVCLHALRYSGRDLKEFEVSP